MSTKRSRRTRRRSRCASFWQYRDSSGGGLPYFLYRMGVRKQTEKMTPLIEEKYDEIYEICEKGSKLL